MEEGVDYLVDYVVGKFEVESLGYPAYRLGRGPPDLGFFVFERVENEADEVFEYVKVDIFVEPFVVLGLLAFEVSALRVEAQHVRLDDTGVQLSFEVVEQTLLGPFVHPGTNLGLENAEDDALGQFSSIVPDSAHGVDEALVFVLEEFVVDPVHDLHEVFSQHDLEDLV